MRNGSMQDAVSTWSHLNCFDGRRIAGSRQTRFAIPLYPLGLLLVLCLTVFNCFWHLSSSAISDMDEARYGVSSSEMLHNHFALITTYAGLPEYWNLKPPLGYWMQELSYRAFGFTVFAMRLPAALCALCSVALTMLMGRIWYGKPVALLAGLMLATCFGFMSHHGARSGDLDAALTLTTLIAMVQIPHLTVSRFRRLLWAGMLALGFLLKSFAIAPFVAVTAVYLLWSKDWQHVRWQEWIAPLALLLLTILAWAVARTWIDHSTYFVHRMLREDLIARSVRNIDTGSTSYWSYTFALFDRFAPWPVLIVAWLLYNRNKGWPPLLPHSRLLICWALVPLIGFSLARTQHHWYLDPSYPAWSMLAANATVSLFAGIQSQRLRTPFAALLLVCLVCCEMRVALRIGLVDRRPAAQQFLMSIHDKNVVPSGETIWVGFPLTNSERFILQVIGGYKLADLAVDEASIPGAEDHKVVLLHQTQVGAAISTLSAGRHWAMGAGYALLTDNTVSAHPADVSRPH